MGSFGWVQCYWCEWDTYGPIIIDWIGAPLCEWCEHHHFDPTSDGSPPRPNAVCHRANTLLVLLRPLHGNPEVARHIASFLEHPFRPGRGRRWTPCT